MLNVPESGRNRVVYAFIGTLSWSRYKYVEFVWGQDQQCFVSSHIKMGAFWGGMSQVLVIDCLKSGVIKPNLYDPDRKSTRLNSSHVAISYAVFCLKKQTRA